MFAQVTTATQPRGDAFSLMGSVVEPLVTGTDTSGAWEAVRTTVGASGRSPLHTVDVDKVFVVLAGEVVVALADADDLGTSAEHRLSAGAVAQVPAGTAHSYRNDSGEPTQLLVLTTGSGHVGFLRGMASLTAGGPPDPTALAAHTAAHGVRLLPASAAPRAAQEAAPVS